MLVPPIIAAAIDMVLYREGLYLFVMACYIFAGPGIPAAIVGLLLEGYGRFRE